MAHSVLATVSRGCPEPEGRFSRVTHPSATQPRKVAFDLHVLSRPPAFILSQDQTLHFGVDFFGSGRTFGVPVFLLSGLTAQSANR